MVRSGTPLGSGTAPTARVRLGRPWQVLNNVVTRDQEAVRAPRSRTAWIWIFAQTIPYPQTLATGGDVHRFYGTAVTTATRCSTTMSSEDAPSAAIATDHRSGRPSTLLGTMRNTFPIFTPYHLHTSTPLYPAPQTPSKNAVASKPRPKSRDPVVPGGDVLLIPVTYRDICMQSIDSCMHYVMGQCMHVSLSSVCETLPIDAMSGGKMPSIHVKHRFK